MIYRPDWGIVVSDDKYQVYMNIKITSAILILITLIHCHSVRADTDIAPTMTELSPATLTIYRTKGYVGSFFGHKTTVNGIFIAKLKPGSYTTVTVAPGDYTICLFTTRMCAEPLSITAGNSYFLRDTAGTAYAGNGVYKFSIYLQLVDNSIASADSAGYKFIAPAQAIFIK